MRVEQVACLLAIVLQLSTHGTNGCGSRPPLGGKRVPVSDTLFLTPFIKAGKFKLAKSRARVGALKGDNVPSYSGYLTVNKAAGSNLFFWFFPALNNAEDAPVFLWLNGGPGATSLLGLFVEHGPYEVTSEGTLRFRNTTWAQQFNMLYIDSPVGTGYSFTKTDAGYATNNTEVARDLFEALQQFFTLFNEYANNDFYVTGESYAGKYVPEIAYMIHQNKDKAKMKLTGMAIGNGFSDPITMVNYADYLEQIGLLDYNQANYFRSEQDKIIRYIEQDDYAKAFDVFNPLILGFLPEGTVTYLQKVTGFSYFYHMLQAEKPGSHNYFKTFVQTAESRRALHVGAAPLADGKQVQRKLAVDIMRSVKPLVAELMNNYKVLLYSGQLDIIVAAPLSASFIPTIPWKGANEFDKAERIIWRDLRTGHPAGYVRKARNFTHILVRNSGHLVPTDQPENAFDMIDRFVNNKPFN